MEGGSSLCADSRHICNNLFCHSDSIEISCSKKCFNISSFILFFSLLLPLFVLLIYENIILLTIISLKAIIYDSWIEKLSIIFKNYNTLTNY